MVGAAERSGLQWRQRGKGQTAAGQRENGGRVFQPERWQRAAPAAAEEPEAEHTTQQPPITAAAAAAAAAVAHRMSWL